VIILDTNVVSEPLRREPDTNVLAWLQAHTREAAVTTVTVYELMYGVHRLRPGRRKTKLTAAVERFLGSLDGRLMAYDEAAARIHAKTRAAREKKGQPISTEDGMIAAIALAKKASVATRNTAHFEGLGVPLINPWSESEG
jgi:toxin FitB